MKFLFILLPILGLAIHGNWTEDPFRGECMMKLTPPGLLPQNVDGCKKECENVDNAGIKCFGIMNNMDESNPQCYLCGSYNATRVKSSEWAVFLLDQAPDNPPSPPQLQLQQQPFIKKHPQIFAKRLESHEIPYHRIGATGVAFDYTCETGYPCIGSKIIDRFRSEGVFDALVSYAKSHTGFHNTKYCNIYGFPDKQWSPNGNPPKGNEKTDRGGNNDAIHMKQLGQISYDQGANPFLSLIHTANDIWCNDLSTPIPHTITYQKTTGKSVSTTTSVTAGVSTTFSISEGFIFEKGSLSVTASVSFTSTKTTTSETSITTTNSKTVNAAPGYTTNYECKQYADTYNVPYSANLQVNEYTLINLLCDDGGYWGFYWNSGSDATYLQTVEDWTHFGNYLGKDMTKLFTFNGFEGEFKGVVAQKEVCNANQTPLNGKKCPTSLKK